MRGLRRALASVTTLVAVIAVAPAAAHVQTNPDGSARHWSSTLFEQQPDPVGWAHQTGGTPAASPPAECGPGSSPAPGMQGRVPAGASKAGYACNVERIGHQGESGGYKVRRFVDRAGHECAYYDTTLLFPLNAINVSQTASPGVTVLDMSDPANPRRTASLTTPAMLSPHESLVLNAKRGLLVAVMGNPAFAPGVIDVYDLNEDCRTPRLRSSTPVGIFGHESGFAPDGNTFYATSIFTGTVTAIDLSDPDLPKPIWVGNYRSHGLTVSADGNRAYIAALGGLIIVDTSEIQARKPNPQVREVSRLSWDSISIPQVAIPITIKGRPHLVEVDEFSADPQGPLGILPVAVNGPQVGAARIIDIGDETRPQVIGDMRLAVHQPENRAALANDPGAGSPAQGYAAHYCNVPTTTDPTIVACSMIASGLRVFDIRDPAKPKEAGYFVAPPTAQAASAGAASNYAMSGPDFVPERKEIWYSDGNSGFYALRASAAAWPDAAGATTPKPKPQRPCALRRIAAQPVRGGRLRLRFGGSCTVRVRVAVLRGGKVVKRFAARTGAVTWKARGARRGRYVIRFRTLRSVEGTRTRTRTLTVRYRGGRFVRRVAKR